MTHLNFSNSQLSISMRSPFARRVRLAFLENGIQYSERVYDVFQHNPDVLAHNPVGRIPILELQSGEIINDSNYILHLFYDFFESSLCPKNAQDKIELAYWQSIAVGLCEKLVEYYLDHVRDSPYKNTDIEQDLKEMSDRIFPILEKKLGEPNKKFLVHNQITQADLDIGTALAYYELRYSTEWKNKYRHIANYYQELNQRPSFQKTAPPK